LEEMVKRMRAREYSLFALGLVIIGVVLIAVALISPSQGSGMMGGGGVSQYDVANVAVGTIGGLLVGIGVVLAFAGRVDQDLAVAPLVPAPIARPEPEIPPPAAAEMAPSPVPARLEGECREDIILRAAHRR
jgi:hypothetical protein